MTSHSSSFGGDFKSNRCYLKLQISKMFKTYFSQQICLSRGYLRTVKLALFLGDSNMLHLSFLWTFSTFIFYFQTTMVHCCNAVECKQHRSKAKKLHIYPLTTDVTWVKWWTDLSAEKIGSTDSAWEEGKKREECCRVDTHKKFKTMFPSFRWGKDQHYWKKPQASETREAQIYTPDECERCHLSSVIYLPFIMCT